MKSLKPSLVRHPRVKTEIFLLFLTLFFLATSSSAWCEELPFELLVPLGEMSHIQWNRMETKSNLDSEVLVKNRVQLIEQLLQAEPDPYVGSRSIDFPCQSDAPPKPQSGADQRGSWNIHWLHATPERVLGVCTQLKSALKVQYLILACKKAHSVIIIRYFSDPSSAWIVNPVARCK